MAKNDDGVMHRLGGTASKIDKWGVLIILLIAIVLGTGAGYIGSTFAPKSTTSTGTEEEQKAGTAKSAGVNDKKRFPDEVEGKLKEGGIEGEGSFHLERPGGESQNVYLTSSIVDLSAYIGKRVRVRGETQKAQKAGWLMDVGYVEVL